MKGGCLHWGDETIAIEKQLIGEGVEPPNERDAIISMITELIKTK